MTINNNITDTGVYEIRCVTTNKVYIGSSKHITRRLREHVNELRKQKHCNSCLQGVWNKYGKGSFVFNCIESLDANISYDELLSIEQTYLDKIQPWKREVGFNLSHIANRPPHLKGESHPMYGKNHTEEAKTKMRVPRPTLSAANKGKTMSERLGRDWVNPLIGTKRDGWISPCKGKKRTNWVSPRKKFNLITLKHVNGEVKSLIPSEWSNIGVLYDLIVNPYRQSFGSGGWYFCPKCCISEESNDECVCDSKKALFYKKRFLNQFTLQHEDGTIKTLNRHEWKVQFSVCLSQLFKRPRESQNGWRLIN